MTLACCFCLFVSLVWVPLRWKKFCCAQRVSHMRVRPTGVFGGSNMHVNVKVGTELYLPGHSSLFKAKCYPPFTSKSP